MDLEELKKFRHRAELDVKDINLALKAVPFLVKEVIRLEEELALRTDLIERLKKKIKRQPPTIQKGQKDKFQWALKIDEDANMIFIQFSGVPNKIGAKMCSNTIVAMSSNLEKGFSVISDFRKISGDHLTKRIMFYFRKIHYLFVNKEVSHIIRVVPDKESEYAKTFPELPVPGGGHIKVFTVTSIEEGKKILKNVRRHLKSS